jgi:methylthioribose-1-phosphate isomerase
MPAAEGTTGFPYRPAPGLVPEPVRWLDGTLEILDQRLLPSEIHYDVQTGVDSVTTAIREMRVRGAPAIGIAAAYGVVLAAGNATQRGSLQPGLANAAATLIAARPTAVNLAWAVKRVMAQFEPTLDAHTNYLRLRAEAEALHADDRRICRAIGAAGVDLIDDGSSIMTHCNAGALAVSELGTATAPMYLAHRKGVRFRVFANETRPVLQGARLTAWELDRAGMDVTLLCDNAAGHLMAGGHVDLVMVGADRVTANGDVVNKIGTSTLAILCHHFDIPFYVACPSSTFDPATPRGADVEIEERPPEEVRSLGGITIAGHIQIRNPGFDVTPQQLVTGFITDRGLLGPPYPDTLAVLK